MRFQPVVRFGKALERRSTTRRRGVAEDLQGADTWLAWVGDRLRVATVVSDLVPARAGRANAQEVYEVADSLGIPCFEVSNLNSGRVQLGVRAEDWERLLRGLAEAGGPGAHVTYLGVPARTRRGRTAIWFERAHDPAIQQWAAQQDVVYLLRYWSPFRGGPVYGERFACKIGRWSRDESGGYAAPERNPRTQQVAEAQLVPTEVTWRGETQRRLLADPVPSVFDVEFPIDVVYLWVDGNDPAWQERFRAAQVAAGGVVPDSVAAYRFRDRDELRHSLRSLEMNMPWVRNIYIVTDRQVPAWLDTDHPRVRIVDHSEIFPSADVLPCFNSHAIGSRIHHIDGLAEHYIIMNDDLFINTPLDPEQFFQSNGAVKFFLSRSRAPHVPPAEMSVIESARHNAARLIEKDFGRRPIALFLHAPVAQRRSIMEELENRYSTEFAELAASRFRSPTDIEVNGWLHHNYAYLTGRGVPARMHYGYYDIGVRETWERLKRFDLPPGMRTFCINDGPSEDGVDRSRELSNWLGRYFPVPSSFERKR